MINNRQAGRRRGRGGQRSPNNPGRPEQGNRIDNRARGNAAQLHEKYKTLARDAQTQGDRVNTEYYLQFADHYFRVLSDSRARFEDQNPNQGQRRQRDDAQDDDFDGDDMQGDDRFDMDEQDNRPSDNRSQGNRSPERQQEQRPQESRPQQDGRQSEGRQREQPQQRRPRYEESDGNTDQPRNDQGRSDSYRGDQNRSDQNRSDQNRGDQVRPPRQDARPQPRREERAEAEPVTNGHDAPDAVKPAARRGRPPRPRPVEDSGEAFDATILPPSVLAPIESSDEDAPAPRRRGRPPRVKPDTDTAQA